MRRVSTFLMFLTAASILTPALVMAQTSSATVSSATAGNGRGFGLGTVAIFAPDGRGVVPNIIGTWGDLRGRYHIDGVFGLLSSGSTSFDLGVRGWYHVHAASSADFSLGAGFAIVSYRDTSRRTDFELDLGAQMRVFVVPNVALLAALGMGIYLPDQGSSVFTISGNIMNSVGLAYYFQ
jgi:hypothetical protein